MVKKRWVQSDKKRWSRGGGSCFSIANLDICGSRCACADPGLIKMSPVEVQRQVSPQSSRSRPWKPLRCDTSTNPTANDVANVLKIEFDRRPGNVSVLPSRTWDFRARSAPFQGQPCPAFRDMKINGPWHSKESFFFHRGRAVTIRDKGCGERETEGRRNVSGAPS